MEFTIIMAVAIGTMSILAIWYVVGTFLTPVYTSDNIKIHMCVAVSGDCEELEQSINGLLWLINNGTVSAQIIIIDNNMDAGTRYAAETLAKCEDKIHIAEIGEIGKWIKT